VRNWFTIRRRGRCLEGVAETGHEPLAAAPARPTGLGYSRAMAVTSATAARRPHVPQVLERWRGTGLTASEAAVLTAVLTAAAAIRFIAIGHQSYWFDESVTVADVRPPSLGGVLSTVAQLESSPPLYYMLVWVWAKLFSLGEAGLRSFSALAGTGTVAVAWAAARRLLNRRAALVTAALLAVNPMLVWYSQEARAYSLLTLFGALSLLFFARLREHPTPANAAGWAVACTLAVLTHYFAAFLFAAEFAWLMIELLPARRLVVLASVPVVLVGLALVPLAYHQQTDGRSAWIAAQPLGGRVVEVLHELGSANVGLISSGSSATRGALGWIAIGLVAGGLAIGVLACTKWERRAVRVPAVVGLGTLLIPLGLSLVGIDYFKDRNLVAAWIPLTVALAGTLVAWRVWRIGLAVAAAICALGLAIDVEVTRDSYLQRQNWRAVAQALGPARQTRAIAVYPGYYASPLELYGQYLSDAQPGARARELVLVGLPPAHPGLPPGFRLEQTLSFNGGLRIERFRAAGLFTIPQARLRGSGARVMVQAGPELIAWLRVAYLQLGRWQRLARTLRRRPTAPVTSLRLAPGANPAGLLNVPPEVRNRQALRAAIRAVLRATASLAAPGSGRSTAASRFQRGLRRFIAAASGR
jgi:mannosyltransferase